MNTIITMMRTMMRMNMSTIIMSMMKIMNMSITTMTMNTGMITIIMRMKSLILSGWRHRANIQRMRFPLFWMRSTMKRSMVLC